ncbi:MAG: hypothetical protein D6718_02510 [Acidobacteria bacterium]|nr:MAG: hypothetical protein D6718_02510 [Acidobacteriota bacterium]
MSARSLIRHLRGMTLPAIESFLERGHVISRAQEYAEDGRVEEIWVDGESLRAHVTGSSTTPYHCVIRLQEGFLEPQCSCPYSRGVCWHVGAVLMTLALEPELFDQLESQAARASRAPRVASDRSVEGDSPPATGKTPPPSPEALEALRGQLFSWRKEELVAELVELAAGDGALAARLAEPRAEPADLDLKLFRQAARAALRPGVRLRRHEIARVASDVRDVAASVGRLLGGGRPEGALDLLEEMAALVWRRIDEADDRDGILARLARDLLREWCTGWASVPGRDRQRLARILFGWIVEDAGGVFAGLVREGAEALGDVGLDTLRTLLAASLDERLRARRGELVEDGEGHGDPLVVTLRRALREAAEARGDMEDFLAHCDPDGRHGGEILAAVRHLARRGDHLEALRWAEKGRNRARRSERAAIDDLRIELLLRLDRRREAIELAWEAYRAEPSAPGLRRLLAVVDPSERAEWRRRALDLCEASADATAFVEVCLAAGATERLVDRLEMAPAYVLAAGEQVLDAACLRLDEQSPAAAARIRIHLAERALAAGDPRQYPRAREHLEQARRACERRGDTALWSAAVERLRAAHAVVRAWWPETAEHPPGS